MKTIFDELKQEVKNWWVSLILGILYVAVALGLMFFPFNGYAALSILFSISMLVSGLLEIAFAVSNRQRVSSWGWYLAGGVIDMIGSHSVYHRLLADVPGIFLGRLCNGLKKVRDKRVGLVYSIRHSCHRMLAYYPVATDGRSYLRRLYDFVCIPYHRILPYHALFRTEESAQTKFPELLIRHRLHRYVQIRYS